MPVNERSGRVERAINYIENHLAEVSGPRDVAAVIGVSYEALRKQFRREVGVPIGRYIRQVRIDRARQLLVETDDPVYVICREVGYSSDSSGIRAFKRVTGLTMDQYRRQYRDGEASK